MGQPFLWDAPCNAPLATNPNVWPEDKPAGPEGSARHSYLVLLPMGFTVPLALPLARWALTPPFHPHLFSAEAEKQAVCFLWHFP